MLAILPAMSGNLVSFIRFESVAFPIFIALAFVYNDLRLNWIKSLKIVTFIVLHVILLWRFVNYNWAG